MTDRRSFLKIAGLGVCSTAVPGRLRGNDQLSDDPFPDLKPMLDGVVPIADSERRARIEKAQQLMVENGFDAIFLEPGTSSFYFTDFQTWLSERMIALIIPARGEPAWICPKFEEERMREIIRFGTDIRTWEEDESPYKVVAGLFNDIGLRTRKIGIEERVRFFLFDGIRKETAGLEYASADPVTAGCRMFKSTSELALLQRANDITLVAYRAAAAKLTEGMKRSEFQTLIEAAFKKLGVKGGAGVNFAEATALPHGSLKDQTLQKGNVVMMDGGCKVEGYQSDITRTIVYGTPTKRQRDIWNLARKAQDAALAAARPGVPCEDVDAAARKVITNAGFGPDYKLPGLPHRTGHGIGLDYHEWTNLVRGNKTPLQIGMCFSNEPTVSIPGEFGVRHEDCMYITGQGARLFTKQSMSIDDPLNEH